MTKSFPLNVNKKQMLICPWALHKLPSTDFAIKPFASELGFSCESRSLYELETRLLINIAITVMWLFLHVQAITKVSSVCSSNASKIFMK